MGNVARRRFSFVWQWCRNHGKKTEV